MRGVHSPLVRLREGEIRFGWGQQVNRAQVEVGDRHRYANGSAGVCCVLGVKMSWMLAEGWDGVPAMSATVGNGPDFGDEVVANTPSGCMG